MRFILEYDVLNEDLFLRTKLLGYFVSGKKVEAAKEIMPYIVTMFKKNRSKMESDVKGFVETDKNNISDIEKRKIDNVIIEINKVLDTLSVDKKDIDAVKKILPDFLVTVKIRGKEMVMDLVRYAEDGKKIYRSLDTSEKEQIDSISKTINDKIDTIDFYQKDIK